MFWLYMCGHFTTMRKSRITWIILINIWALFRILHTLILEFPLYCLYCNFLYQSPFFFSPANNTNNGDTCYCCLVFSFIIRFFFWKESLSHASGKAKVLTTGWDNTILGAEWIFKKENEKVCLFQGLFLALLT